MSSNQQLAKEDLKAIINGLKMSGLSFVEVDALDVIKERIDSLPSSEKLDALNVNSLKNVQKEIEYIMRAIDNYGMRNPEFKARNKSRTNGLPPRYKVLDWKKATVNKIITASKNVDDKGYWELSEKLILLAKNVVDDQIDQKQYLDIANEVEKQGFAEDGRMIREAFLGELGNKIKDLVNYDKNKGNKASANILKRLENVIKKIKEAQKIINDTLGGSITLKPVMADQIGKYKLLIDESLANWLRVQTEVTDSIRNGTTT